jgi:hypothetical protein
MGGVGMSVRRFDAVDDKIVLGPIDVSPYESGFSLGVLYRPDASLGSGEMTLIGVHDDLGGGQQISDVRLGINAAGQPFLSSEKPATASGDRVTAPVGLTEGVWYLIVVAFSFGDVWFDIYNFSASALDYSDSPGILTPPVTGHSSSVGVMWLGGHVDSYATVPLPNQAPLGGDLAAAVAWPDAAAWGVAEAMATANDQGEWDVYSPVHRWELRQNLLGDSVTDQISNADEVSRTGTTVVADNPPVPYSVTPMVGNVPRNAPLPTTHYGDTTADQWKTFLSASVFLAPGSAGGDRVVSENGWPIPHAGTPAAWQGVRAARLQHSALVIPGKTLEMRLRVVMMVGFGDTWSAIARLLLITGANGNGNINLFLGTLNPAVAITATSTDNQSRFWLSNPTVILPGTDQIVALGLSGAQAVPAGNYYCLRLAAEYANF